MTGLFGEVLLLCARSGLAKVGVIAIDGTKVQANASREANADYEQLAREIIEEAKAIDAAEDELYGDRRGDELPEELSSAQGRRGWLREAKRRLEAERDRSPQPVPRSRPKRVKEAKRRLEEELCTECRANEAYEATARDGWNGRRFSALRPIPTAAEHAAGAHQHDRPGLARCQGPARLHPGLQRPGRHQRAPDRHRRRVMTAGTRLRASRADARRDAARAAGHRSRGHAGRGPGRRRLLASAPDGARDRQGSQVLIPPDTGKRKTPRPGWTGGYYAFMRRVLAGERGSELYGRRQPMIEPVFGHTKFNRGMARFNDEAARAVAPNGGSSPPRTTSWDETARRGLRRWCPGAGLASGAPGQGLCGRTQAGQAELEMGREPDITSVAAPATRPVALRARSAPRGVD